MGILFRTHAALLYEVPQDLKMYMPDDDKPDWRAYDTDLQELAPSQSPLDDDDPE